MSLRNLSEALRHAVRDVPDFPKPGILFRDITPVLLHPNLFLGATRAMADPFRNDHVNRVLAIESRGFLFGSPIAQELGAGLVPVRKPGKLPAARQRVDYALEYGTDALEMHADAISPGDVVLIVDDVLATGGTAAAAADLVRGRGATLGGFSFLLELDGLRGRDRLGGARAEALIHYA
jgi:adenine phosphoribosyltransferase